MHACAAIYSTKRCLCKANELRGSLPSPVIPGRVGPSREACRLSPEQQASSAGVNNVHGLDMNARLFEKSPSFRLSELSED